MSPIVWSWRRLVLPLWLMLAWILLWGTWSIANLATGLVLGFAVPALLPLPAVELGGRIRPLGVLRFVGWFARELVLSSVQVSWRAISPRPVEHNAVVAVALRTRSDAVLTVTTETLTLIPGTLVIEVNRDSWTLYAHVLDVADLDEVERIRQVVLDLEARVVRAIGSDEQLQIVARDRVGGLA